MGAAFLSFWCYMGKAEDSSGHPFELEQIRFFFLYRARRPPLSFLLGQKPKNYTE